MSFDLNSSIRRNELRLRRTILRQRVLAIEFGTMSRSEIEESGLTMVQCIQELQQIEKDLHTW